MVMRWLKRILAAIAVAVIAAYLSLTFSGAHYAREAEAAFPPLGAFVEVDGLNIHYLDKGEGPVVILVHGASGNLRDWTFSLFDQLAETHRVIAFDRPGLGWSDRPERDGEIPTTQALILAKAADKLGASDAVLVGHSMGGAVSAAWAVERPETLAGLVLLAGATMDWGGGGGLLYDLGATAWAGPAISSLARMTVSGEALSETMDRVFAPNPAPKGYAEALGLDLALRRRNFQDNAADISHLAGHLAKQSERYGEIGLPVILLHGDADDIVGLKAHSEPFAARAPNAELRILPGVGHMLHHVDEAAILKAIEDLTPQAD